MGTQSLGKLQLGRTLQHRLIVQRFTSTQENLQQPGSRNQASRAVALRDIANAIDWHFSNTKQTTFFCAGDIFHKILDPFFAFFMLMHCQLSQSKGKVKEARTTGGEGLVRRNKGSNLHRCFPKKAVAKT